MFTNHSFEFWVATIVAVIVKIKTSGKMGLVATISTIAVSVGSAYAFSPSLSSWLGTNEILIAALVTLTSEGIMRFLIEMSADTEELKELLKLYRGGYNGKSD